VPNLKTLLPWFVRTPPPQASASASRIVELDGLRGLAVLAVVYFHYTTRFSQVYGYTDIVWWPNHSRPFGLPIFFMLSGYFIAKTMEEGVRPVDFIVSRFSRLFPAYWLCVLATFVIARLADLPERQVQFDHLIVNMTMLQEFFRVPHVDTAYWTLTVEISFYVWMLALFAAGKLKRFEFFLAAWLAAMLLWGWRDLILPGFTQKSPIVTFLLLGYAHLFVAGIVVYRVRTTGWTLSRVLLLTTCAAAPWIVPRYHGRFLTSCAMGFFLISVVRMFPILRWRPLVLIGIISYPLYLLHQNIGYVFIRSLTSIGVNANVCIPAAICVMIVPAWLVTRYVERPAISFIRSRYAEWRQKPRAVADCQR
jgi:peptidoglycan/LPS O-acetylase OafA/YrhL